MRLRDVMSVDVITVGPDDPASVARAAMRRHRVRQLVVVEASRPVGIVSERDLGGAKGSASRRDRAVRDLMAADPVTARPSTTLRQAAESMRGRTAGSLLVVEHGRLVGIVTTTDLLDRLDRADSPIVVTEQPRRRDRPPVGRAAGEAPRQAGGRAKGGGSRRTDARRAALPPSLPRAAKHVRGRTHEIPPPGHIRVFGATVSQQDRDGLARKLGTRLGKFASSIERITVRVSDVNGPKGGVDHKCLIKVVLSGLPSVVVERHDSSFQRAVNAAIGAAEQAVRRAVQRRRSKPLHRRRGRAVTAAT